MARTPVRTFLRGCLRGLNYLLAIVGVLMVAYALFMYVEFTDAHPELPPANDITTLPSRSVAGRHESVQLSAAMQVEHDLGHGIRFQVQNDLAQSTNKLTKFIYLLGGAGAFIFLTASIGILSADCAACGVTCFLGMYHALMVLLLLLQICLVCFYFFNKSWEEDLPPDSTGEYAKLRALVMHHIYACKLIGLSTLGLQILALMVSCSLYYAENTPRYEYRAVAMEPQDYETASQISVQARSAEAMTQ